MLVYQRVSWIAIHNPNILLGRPCRSPMEICSPCSVGSHFPAASPARDHHVLGWGSPGTGVSWKSSPDGAAGIATPLKNDGVKVSWDYEIPKYSQYMEFNRFQTTNQMKIITLLDGTVPWFTADSLRILLRAAVGSLQPGLQAEDENCRTFYWTEAWFVGTDIGANVFRYYDDKWEWRNNCTLITWRKW